MPLAALVTPLNIQICLLDFNFLTICTVDAVYTVFSVNAVYTVFTVGARRLDAGVDFSDPPVAVFADKRCFTVFAVRAVLSVCSVFSGGAVFAISAVSAIRTF